MPTPTPGQRWKAAREAAGLSVQEAAKLAQVHRNTIYDLEKDDDGVTLRIMRKVAPIYGVELGAIFREESQADRLPAEFRPLLEPLHPLTQQQREAVIRNVAANLSFMSMIYSYVPPPAMERPERPRVNGNGKREEQAGEASATDFLLT